MAEDAEQRQELLDTASEGSSPATEPATSGPAEQVYQALYRRYRPQRFAEVRGQEHVTRALCNAVRDGRVAHAYLFSGPRGTGKTSTARILAMALNCESPRAGEPDGTCASCTSIRSGASMDVFELDAASNRKLDEMRDLLSRVALGTPGRWKVYIIDEVHQLTADAASALLKTLEEPPAHVVFVLATTDPQKVLATILSRTQHFEFRLLDGDVLVDLLSSINKDARLGLAPEAVQLAVEKGRGSARDAESALEQLAAAGGSDDEVTAPLEVVDALVHRDVGQTLQAVARAISKGREPRRLANDLVEHLRNAFLATQAPSLVLLPAAATSELAEASRQMGLPYLVRAMETVGQALVDMRDSVDPRVTLEVALIRLVSPAADISPAALLQRIERLERELAHGGTAPGQVAALAAPPGRLRPESAGPGDRPESPGAAEAAVSRGPAPAAGIDEPQPAGPAQARVALGAFFRGGGGAPAASKPATGTPEPQVAPSRRPDGPSARSLPTRDQLTIAWGDAVLGKLTQAARVYMASGRFLEVTDGAAVFALPDAGLVSKGAAFVAEAESALAAHFGQRVPLRIVLDKGPVVTGERGAPPEAGTGDDYEIEEMSELVDATDMPVVSAEQRVLLAFPGAVLDE